MIKKEIIERGGIRHIVTSQYDNTGRLLRMLGKSIPIQEKKKEEEWEVTSPFLKIWEK